MSSNFKLTKEAVEKIVKECNTVADFCRKVGWEPRGGNYNVFYNYVNEYGIDISHFKPVSDFLLKGGKYKKSSAEEYAKKSSYIRSSTLLKKILDDGIRERKCECCGNTEWQGKKIPLELHHIDGNHYNNDFENLQLLCPNCHFLTENYRGKKNKGKRFYCIKCGKEITKYSKSGLCVACSNKRYSKTEISSKEEFIKTFLEYKTFSSVARKYGCSDNNIKKWARKFGLPTKSGDMKKYLNQLENEITTKT